MLHIAWSEEYRVDGGSIDEEHQSLVDLANRVFALAEPLAQREELADVVKALFAYMDYHFRHEEMIMLENDYPALVEHAICHKQLIDEMTQSLRTIKDVEQYALRLRHMMVDWVLIHIINEDKQIGVYLKQRRKFAASQA